MLIITIDMEKTRFMIVYYLHQYANIAIIFLKGRFYLHVHYQKTIMFMLKKNSGWMQNSLGLVGVI